MSNISDIIEEFLRDTMGDAPSIDISRNELAEFFNVAPSQINYVLTTRFNYEHGFVTNSKRGGGGYITIQRAASTNDEWLSNILIKLSRDGEIDMRTGEYILQELVGRGVLADNEADIARSTIHASTLGNPFRLENKLRANILRRVIIDKIEKGGK